MVRLPRGFVKTRYSGYFWDTINQHLYSIKVSGKLRRMSRRKYSGWNNTLKERVKFDGYQVSVNGARRSMSFNYLSKLKWVEGRDQVIPFI